MPDSHPRLRSNNCRYAAEHKTRSYGDLIKKEFGPTGQLILQAAIVVHVGGEAGRGGAAHAHPSGCPSWSEEGCAWAGSLADYAALRARPVPPRQRWQPADPAPVTRAGNLVQG